MSHTTPTSSFLKFQIGSPSRIKTSTTQSNHTKPLLSFNHHSNTLQKHPHTFLLETYTASTQKEKPINANCYIKFITKCRYIFMQIKLPYQTYIFHQELPTTTSKRSRSPSRSGGVPAKRKKWEKGDPRKESWVTTLLVVQWSVCHVWRVRWHWVEETYISLNAT